MQITLVAGVRPHFVKLRALLPELEARHDVRLVNTSQHYDSTLSDVFFAAGSPRRPDRTLERGLDADACVSAIVADLRAHRPHAVLVMGDAQTSLLGAIAASLAGVPTIHLEAGVRSFDQRQVEERNRRAIDALTVLHLASSADGIANLEQEGSVSAVLAGDVLLDVLEAEARPRSESRVLDELELTAGDYVLATVHRQEARHDVGRLHALLAGIAACDCRVILPLHPATRGAIKQAGIGEVLERPGVHVAPPLGHADVTALAERARVVATDSNGLQRESFYLGTYCVVLRAATEFRATVASCRGELVADGGTKLTQALERAPALPALRDAELAEFGGGTASARVAAEVGGIAAVEQTVQ